MADSSDEDLPPLVVSDAHSSGSDEEEDEGSRAPAPASVRPGSQPFQRTGQGAAPTDGPYFPAPVGVSSQGTAQQPIPGLGGQAAAAADGPGMVTFQMPLLMQMPGAQGTVQVHLGFGQPPLGLGPMNGAPGPPMWHRPEEQEEEPLFMSRAERLHREQREQHRVPFMMPMMGNAAADGSGDGSGLMGLQMPFLNMPPGAQQGAGATEQQQAQPLMPFLTMLSSMMGAGIQPPDSSNVAHSNSQGQRVVSSAGTQPASSGRGRGIAMQGAARRTVRVARRPRAPTPPLATQPLVQREQLPVPPRFQLPAEQQGADGAPAESQPSQQQLKPDVAGPSSTPITSAHGMRAAATSGVRSYDPFAGGVCLTDSDDEEADAAPGSPQQQQQQQEQQQEEDRFLAQRRRQREQQYERFDRQQVELPASLQARQPAATASRQAPDSAAGQASAPSGSANELPGSDSDGPIIFTFTSSSDSDGDAAEGSSGPGAQLQRAAQQNAQQDHAQRAVAAADGGDDDSVPELHSDTDTDTEGNSDGPEPAEQQSGYPGQHGDQPHDQNHSDSVPDLDSGSSSDDDSSPRTPLHRQQQQEERQQQEEVVARPFPAVRPAGLPGPVLPVRTRASNARGNASAAGGAAAPGAGSDAASGSLAASAHGEAAGGTSVLTPRLSDAASSADSLPPLENSSSCNSEDSDSLDGWDAGYGEPCPALVAGDVSSEGLDEKDSEASWETASDDDVAAAAAPGQQQQQQQQQEQQGAASSRLRRDAFFVPPGAQGTQLLTPEATEQLQRQVQQQLGLIGEQQQTQARHMAPRPHLRHLFMNEAGAGAPAAADGAAAAGASPFNLRFGRSGNSRSSAAPKPAAAHKRTVPAPIKQLLKDKEVLGQLLAGLAGVDAGSACIKSALAHLVAS